MSREHKLVLSGWALLIVGHYTPVPWGLLIELCAAVCFGTWLWWPGAAEKER